MIAKDFIAATGTKILPRILTQICRDSESPFWGCCDRHWWHYKIRDFPSIILQQAGYTIALAADVGVRSLPSKELKDLAAQSCRFWNERALRHGAFEEYYPYEEGYPPVAFSTLAVAKLCADGVIDTAEIMPGLEVATRQLLSRFEAEAANQQVAGTAALAVLRNLTPDLVPDGVFSEVLSRTLDLQKKEGWFPEYDGPDLGYLSVTMDCLWDIYDATKNERCYKAIIAAFDYISWFVLGPYGGAGMHNSRNTDYIVPYGIARLTCESNGVGTRANEVMERLYGSDLKSGHFFDAVDDRYWCHYIGHSVYRALQVFTKSATTQIQETPEIHNSRLSSMPDSGHFVLCGDSELSPQLLVSTRKGSIFSAVWPGGQRACDFGWIVQSGKSQFVSHWWSSDWKLFNQDGITGCDGYLVPHKERVSVPWKHMVLRLASFFMGRKLIRLLKRLMIFKKCDSSYPFSRRISCDGAVVLVEDRIFSCGDNDKLIRAPRASKRHVASADSFHIEDFKLINGVKIVEDIRRVGPDLTVITRFVPLETSAAQ